MNPPVDILALAAIRYAEAMAAWREAVERDMPFSEMVKTVGPELQDAKLDLERAMWLRRQLTRDAA